LETTRSLRPRAQGAHNSCNAIVLHVCHKQPAQKPMILNVPPLPGAPSCESARADKVMRNHRSKSSNRLPCAYPNSPSRNLAGAEANLSVAPRANGIPARTAAAGRTQKECAPPTILDHSRAAKPRRLSTAKPATAILRPTARESATGPLSHRRLHSTAMIMHHAPNVGPY
jgi:hypothetical protein